jgi:hypothetical protein
LVTAFFATVTEGWARVRRFAGVARHERLAIFPFPLRNGASFAGQTSASLVLAAVAETDDAAGNALVEVYEVP